MRQSIGGRVLVTLLLLAPAAPVGAQSFAWWKSEQFQKEVGLTTEQCTRIDNIFQATLPKLRESKEELDKQEAKLSNLIAEAADEARVVRQVDRVEAVRASLNKMHTLMLLRERQVLTPEQLVKFKAAYEQWRKDHPRPPRSGDAPVKK
jgi:Spy/CpxP family protein refolding chaperone